MMILKEFSRIVCVSLFSYQGSLFVCLSDSSFTLSHSSVPVKYFFQVFSRHFLMSVCRSQATCLLYHMFVSLSTIIFVFSKLFKLFNQKKQFLATAQLEYHCHRDMSTLFETFFIFQFRTLCVLQPPNTAAVTFSPKIAINTSALIRAFSSYAPPLTQSLNSYHFPILSRRNSIAFFKLTIKI